MMLLLLLLLLLLLFVGLDWIVVCCLLVSFFFFFSVSTLSFLSAISDRNYLHILLCVKTFQFFLDIRFLLFFLFLFFATLFLLLLSLLLLLPLFSFFSPSLLPLAPFVFSPLCLFASTLCLSVSLSPCLCVSVSPCLCVSVSRCLHLFLFSFSLSSSHPHLLSQILCLIPPPSIPIIPKPSLSFFSSASLLLLPPPPPLFFFIVVGCLLFVCLFVGFLFFFSFFLFFISFLFLFFYFSLMSNISFQSAMAFFFVELSNFFLIKRFFFFFFFFFFVPCFSFPSSSLGATSPPFPSPFLCCLRALAFTPSPHDISLCFLSSLLFSDLFTPSLVLSSAAHMLFLFSLFFSHLIFLFTDPSYSPTKSFWSYIRRDALSFSNSPCFLVSQFLVH